MPLPDRPEGSKDALDQRPELNDAALWPPPPERVRGFPPPEDRRGLPPPERDFC